AEARLDDLTAGGRLAAQPGPLATLALEHALVPRDDDLEAGDARRQGLADRSDHLGDAVRVHGPDPLHAQAVQRLRDGHRHGLVARVLAGGRHAGLAGRRRVEIVAAHQDRGLAVVHRGRAAAGEARVSYGRV